MTKLDMSSLIKERIKNFNKISEKSEIGKVLVVYDGIAIVSGLDDTKMGEILVFPGKIYGVASNLESETIGVVLLGNYSNIVEGDVVKRTKKVVSVPVGDELLGRIVNSLGQAIDGKKSISTKKTRPIEREALGIMSRESVNEPMETGILSIDSMVPIGKGQRELIIGDRKTGKTSIALDTIINQKGKNVKCVYVSIGQKNSTLATITQKLINNDALSYTVIVSANSSDSDAMQSIAPFSGMAIAEEWMENGENVLIVFDDLTKHAVAHRSISLLLRRPPGREAYPGDVFYLHSRLLERASNLNKEYGGGSITALPIIETQAGDISAYIPTNVISITDGQIFLQSNAFNSGQRPAVDAGKSVSRVGSSAQTKLMKKTSSSLKLQLANYEEIKSFSEFSSDLDIETTLILENGKKIMELLKQKQLNPYPQEVQAIILFLINEKLIEKIPLKKISIFKQEFINDLLKTNLFKDILVKLKTTKDISAENSTKLKFELNNYINKFNKKKV